MASPDMTPYVDLRLYDKTPTDIYNAALSVLQTNLPDWTPEQTNTEVLLLQALAVEVAEAAFSLNRLPQAMVNILLKMCQIERSVGNYPVTTLEFTVNDTAGYTIPARTKVAVYWPGKDQSYLFETDRAVSVAVGQRTATVTATGKVRTAALNGTLPDTSADMVSSVVAVNSVKTADYITSGVDPESDTDFYTRGVQIFQRMTTTLVIPSHFQTAALELTTLVGRCNILDNYNPEVGPEPGDNQGNITLVVYGVGDLLTTQQKEDLRVYLSNRAATNLLIHVIDADLQTEDVTVTVKKYSDYTDLEVQNAVTAALTSYMSPNVWPWRGTLRRNELIALISNVEGVDYVETLTVPAADKVYGLETSLVSLGNLTLSVT